MRWNGGIEAEVAEAVRPRGNTGTDHGLADCQACRAPARHTPETASAVHPALLGPFCLGRSALFIPPQLSLAPMRVFAILVMARCLGRPRDWQI
jgi:hypothetical protein